MAKSPVLAARDNRANQLNPAHPAYYLSRGLSATEAQFQASHCKPALDNHANQLNPNHPEFKGPRDESSSEPVVTSSTPSSVNAERR